MKEILHYSAGQKLFLILLRKTLERESFCKRGRRSPPPLLFFIMTQDIQIAKFLNSLLKMANGLKLEVNGPNVSMSLF